MAEHADFLHVLSDSRARVLFVHDVGAEVVDLRERLVGAALVGGAADSAAPCPSLEMVVDLSACD